jgi:hypothetical protein
MTAYGGWGGVEGGRALDPDDAFEMAVERALGARIRADEATARAMWSALANVEWRHVDGDEASYSFRAAGDMIAAIRGGGDYMDWYCCGPYATIRADIADVMRAQGWAPTLTWTVTERNLASATMLLDYGAAVGADERVWLGDWIGELEARAEAAIEKMYDASSSTAAAGAYAEAKDSLSDALGLAERLGQPDAVARIKARLAHVKAVFRSQFPT